MRIISGKLGGRQFQSPAGHRTHPMSDKARGGLFNSLGDIAELSVLDAFAGSGAISFEAASRGAEPITAIDIDKKAVVSMRHSAIELGLQKSIKIILANVSSWSDNNQNERFDLVIVDPPYDKLNFDLVAKLSKHLKFGGLMVLSLPGNTESPLLSALKLISTKAYGDAQLLFYRKI